MAPSNFSFLEREFPILFNMGQSEEFYMPQEPVTSMFKMHLFAEGVIEKLFEEHALKFPYDN